MNALLNTLAKFIHYSANMASASTSVLIYYQPKKPKCLIKREAEKE